MTGAWLSRCAGQDNSHMASMNCITHRAVPYRPHAILHIIFEKKMGIHSRVQAGSPRAQAATRAQSRRKKRETRPKMQSSIVPEQKDTQRQETPSNSRGACKKSLRSPHGTSPSRISTRKEPWLTTPCTRLHNTTRLNWQS